MGKIILVRVPAPGADAAVVTMQRGFKVRAFICRVVTNATVGNRTLRITASGVLGLHQRFNHPTTVAASSNTVLRGGRMAADATVGLAQMPDELPVGQGMTLSISVAGVDAADRVSDIELTVELD